jgi:hypothetical protein
MPGSNPDQRQRWAIWHAAILFPVTQGMDADAQSLGESFLAQAGEAAQGNDVAEPSMVLIGRTAGC